MPNLRQLAPLVATLALNACAATHASRDNSATGEAEVRNAELAFAKSMADRDFDAFRRHLSSDAVFFDDDHVSHGAQEVASAWKTLFDGPKAPFSWAPDHIEVLASGDLALSTGPVMVNDKIVARFNSIWRLEAPHTWRIVFDKGASVCGPAAKQ